MTTNRQPQGTPWTYHVCFGTDDTSLLENGPHAYAGAALDFAISMLGKTMSEALNHGGSEAREGDEYADAIITGYTIERYDGEATDDNWSINGGLSRHARPSA